MIEYGWISVYLYYEEPFESLLIKGIKPFMQPLVESGLIQRYFFIRYYEDGPHIRLRIRGEKDMLETIIFQNLEEHFQRYFRLEPSVRLEERADWYPNNSMKLSKYVPEVGRYGGQFGVTVAERQFHLSSEVVLQVIEKYGEYNWTEDIALGEGIQLNLSMAFACGLNLEESIQFFDFFCTHWVQASIYLLNISAEQIEEEKARWFSFYETNFQNNKDLIVNQNAALWQVLNDKEEFHEDYMNAWIGGNQLIYKDLASAYEGSLLSARDSKYIMKNTQQLSEKTLLVWSILSDYVHITNNRLGISTENEAFMAYLIKRSLEELVV